MRASLYTLVPYFLLFNLVAASHSSYTRSHARRSLARRQDDSPSLLDTLNNAAGELLDGVIDGVLPEDEENTANGLPIGGGNSTTSTSASSTASSSSSSPLTTNTATITETTSTSTTTTSTSTTTSVPNTTVVLGPTSQTLPPVSTTETTTSTSTTTSVSSASTTETTTAAETTTSSTETTTAEETTSTSETLSLPISLSLSIPTIPLPTLTPTETSAAESSTITPDPSTTTDITSAPVSEITSAPASEITSAPASEITSAPVTDITTDITTDISTDISTDITTDINTDISTHVSDVTSVPPVSDVSSSTVVPLPSITVSVNSTVSVPPSSSSEPFSTPIATASVDKDYEWLGNATSLLLMSTPATATITDEATDVDAPPTTTATIATQSRGVELTPVQLPSNRPNTLYPRPAVISESDDLSGYTLVSILFSRSLGWTWVVDNDVAAGQIFGYMPVILANALGVPSSEIKTLSLQIYVPATYKGPEDADQLGTLYLAYIPTPEVETLATLIKTKSSSFYTATKDSVAVALAQQVNGGFSLLSVPDPNKEGDSGLPGAQTGASATNKSRQDAIIGVVSALGAIALFVLVFLVYRSIKRKQELAHRRMSDPQDMVGYKPEGREFDQDSLGGQRRRSFYFAEDSLRTYGAGAAASTSAAGGRQQERYMDNPFAGGDAYDYHTEQQYQRSQMRSRVGTGAISAPILRESSMNW